MRVETSGEDPAHRGDTWADHNRVAALSGPYDVVEHYPAGDTSALALRLHHEGLIYRINREVLHPLGLALGIASADIDHETLRAATISALTICATDDGEPIEYTPAQIARNERKLEAAHGAR